MSEADKMFEKLGWEKKEFDISIDKRYKGIAIDTWLEITELKAINQKCKELGWLDD